jgi:DNA-directed RNA polymerase II subunit RPB2
MERDCMLAHGTANFIHDRTYKCSDKYQIHICNKCGLKAIYNSDKNIYLCQQCENYTDFSKVKIPYAFKLLMQELITMNIAPRIIT